MRVLTPATLSAAIKQYRKENKLSQREFAKKVGLSYKMLQLIEKGENTTLERVLEILDFMDYVPYFFRKD